MEHGHDEDNDLCPPDWARVAPGPPARPLLGHFLEFNRDRAGFLRNLAREYGDVAEFRLGPDRFFLLNHPDYIHDVLVTHQANFHKGRALTRAKRLMGEGLLTSEEEFHLRQRRLMQPAFHGQRIAMYARSMVERTARLTREWEDGIQLEVRHQMLRLTLGIVCQALFNTEVDGDTAEVGRAFSELMELAPFLLAPFSEHLEKLPLPQSIRFRRAKARLDRVVDKIIHERRQSGEDHGDLLSTLLASEDQQGGTGRMEDAQVRDECMTILVAGHETLSNTLAFTWYLLSQHPAIETKLHDEVDSVLGSRLPTLDDLARLPYTEMVLSESMRLFPPVWFLGRRVHDSQGFVRRAKPVRDAQRSAFLPQSGHVRSRTLDAGGARHAAPVRLLPVRGRRAPVHRRLVRVDRGPPGVGGRRPTMDDATCVGPPGRGRGCEHAQAKIRDAHDCAPAVMVARCVTCCEQPGGAMLEIPDSGPIGLRNDEP